MVMEDDASFNPYVIIPDIITLIFVIFFIVLSRCFLTPLETRDSTASFIKADAYASVEKGLDWFIKQPHRKLLIISASKPLSSCTQIGNMGICSCFLANCTFQNLQCKTHGMHGCMTINRLAWTIGPSNKLSIAHRPPLFQRSF